jgi:hypothetical protein
LADLKKKVTDYVTERCDQNPYSKEAEKEGVLYRGLITSCDRTDIQLIGVSYTLKKAGAKPSFAICRTDIEGLKTELEALLGKPVYALRTAPWSELFDMETAGTRTAAPDDAPGAAAQDPGPDQETAAAEAAPSNEPEPENNIRFVLDDDSTFGPDAPAPDDPGLPWLRVPLETNPWLVVKRVVGDPVLDRSDEGLRHVGSMYRGRVEEIIEAVGGPATDTLAPDVAAFLRGDLLVLRGGLPPKGTGRVAASFKPGSDTLETIRPLSASA